MRKEYRLGAIEHHASSDAFSLHDGAIYEDEMQQFEALKLQHKEVVFRATDMTAITQAFANSMFSSPSSVSIDRVRYKEDGLGLIFNALSANSNLKEFTFFVTKISDKNVNSLINFLGKKPGLIFNCERLEEIDMSDESRIKLNAALKSAEVLDTDLSKLAISVRIPSNISNMIEEIATNNEKKASEWGCVIS